MVQPVKEANAFGQVEALGPDIVPYLVGHLSDMRPLPIREITLSNTAPDAFEGLRHYQPAVVHDALAAILNQLTAQNFVFVYNGASQADRQSNTAQWREWCARTYPAKSLVCAGRH
jgi:hypothetical protein